MAKRGELKNVSKVIEEVFSQKHFRIGIDNIKVQEAWIKTMGKNIQKYTYLEFFFKYIIKSIIHFWIWTNTIYGYDWYWYSNHNMSDYCFPITSKKNTKI